ncbi:MAG: hypothetical protein J6J70_00090 [Methanocorpusculaceae archaeon]|nr:hypothetical protein [Methanocorpusculaceae archaeon]
MKPKGYIKVGISRITEARLQQARSQMIAEHPDKYPPGSAPSLHSVIVWLLDKFS